MKKTNLKAMKKPPIIEILDNSSAEKIQINGYKKVLIPYNNSFSFCIFAPEEETKNTLPFYIEDIIQNIPIKIIILNSEFRLISTNITEKDFLETVYKKVELSGKEHLEKLYLFETVYSNLSFKQSNYRLTINPMIRHTNNPGYICTIEDTTQQKTKLLQQTNTIIDNILYAKNLRKLNEISEKIKSFFEIDTVFFFEKDNTGLNLVFSSCKTTLKKTSLPSTIEKEIKKKDLLLISKQLLPLKGFEKHLMEFVFIYNLKLSKGVEFLVIGSSRSPVNYQHIQKFNWIFKIFFLTYLQLQRTNKLGNAFEAYKLPIILVNKQTLKIEYSNRSFKKHFGEKTLFFNTLFSPQSNIKILKKLETEFEPFSDNLETSMGENKERAVNITVIPGISSGNENLFAVIFKTHQKSIHKKHNLQAIPVQKELDIENILTLVQKYLSIITKTKNIEKSINFVLKDISRNLNAAQSFIANIDKNKNEVFFVYAYNKAQYPNIQNMIKTIEKKSLYNLSPNKIHQFKIGTSNLEILLTRLKPIHNNEYLWGIVFEKNRQISLNEKIAAQNFKSILTIALRKKEKEKVYAKIEKDKEALEKINKEIITTLSHEIKTPLTSILGLSEVILTKLNKEDQKLAVSIKENALNLLELLETILEVNKIEKKGIEVIKKRVINTNEFIKSIESFVHGINKNPNVKFRIVSQHTKPFFKHDTTILYRIIVNLLDNAFRHTKRGLVTLSLNLENEKLIVEVKDTGTGISKKNLENIFVPFFQETSPNKNNKKNVGLGLYIVKRLCDIINGEIEVKSEKNIGTYFKITIPLKENYELNSNS